MTSRSGIPWYLGVGHNAQFNRKALTGVNERGRSLFFDSGTGCQAWSRHVIRKTTTAIRKVLLLRDLRCYTGFTF